MDPTLRSVPADRLARIDAILERARRLSGTEVARLVGAFRGEGRPGEQDQVASDRRRRRTRALSVALALSGQSLEAHRLQAVASVAVRTAAERLGQEGTWRSLGLLYDAQLAVGDAALAVMLQGQISKDVAALLSQPFDEATAEDRVTSWRSGRVSRHRLIERRRVSAPLATYTAASIAIGFAVLAWATATLPLSPGIANLDLPRIGGNANQTGLFFWLALGLLGSMRTSAFRGRAVLTFHLPFIVAAFSLGGPVAGGWVAAISTLELRELREVPWFGTLANHAVLALSGVIGGMVVVSLGPTMESLVNGQLATFFAVLAGAFAFCIVNVAMGTVTIGLRERLTIAEALSTFDRSYRKSVGAEVVLGWLLALSYGAIAWWAPVACVILVLLVWQANNEHELTNHDPMTGLLNRTGFQERFATTLSRVRRGRQTAALLMLDLDGFKAINDGFGHAAGDEVLKVVGTRLHDAIRFTDAAARLGGDEFALLLERIPDVRTAEAVARRIHAQLCEPLTVGSADVSVGASLGLVFLSLETMTTPMDVADAAMYQAKERGGGVKLAEHAV